MSEINLSGDWRSHKSAAPGDKILCAGLFARVQRVQSYPPKTHPDAPIDPTLHAVEIVTERGSRWAAAESTPEIRGDLRMHWGGSA